jgi:hypothetical protein
MSSTAQAMRDPQGDQNVTTIRCKTKGAALQMTAMVRRGVIGMVILVASDMAHAVDGCTALLCLAAPKWDEIPMCAIVIRQLLHDLARGRPFPSCAMSGDDNAAGHEWSRAPDFCPVQYTRVEYLESGVRYTCDYAGAVTVKVRGLPFTRTWWTFDGSSVTEYSPEAKATLQRWDPRFDNDLAAWHAARSLRPDPLPPSP